MGADILAFLDSQTASVETAAIKEAVEGKADLKVKALQELFRSGQVERTGNGKKGDPYLFRPAQFRSPPTVGTAERNSVSRENPDGNGTYSVPPFPGVSQN